MYQLLNIPAGAQVLELGVGTGTSFPAYPRHCEVIGIDLASDMLVRARAKIAKNTWSHLQVMEMDALDLTFADNSFDYVTAFHTVTAASAIPSGCWVRPSAFAVQAAKSLSSTTLLLIYQLLGL